MTIPGALLSLLPESFKNAVRRRAGAVLARDRVANLRRAGFLPRKIIDAGAYRGDWATMVSEVFPDAEILLIEPQPARAGDLNQVCRIRPHLRFSPVALGAVRRRAAFCEAESNSRLVTDNFTPSPGIRRIEVEVVPLAELAAAEGFADTEFLKLDLQGHEMEALAGAGALFGAIEVVQIEVSCLRIGPVPIFHEVHEVFRARGYRLYDVFGLNYRPLDGALWQADCIFVRESSKLLANPHYG